MQGIMEWAHIFQTYLFNWVWWQNKVLKEILYGPRSQKDSLL